MITDSIGILVVTYVALISSVPAAFHLALCITVGCNYLSLMIPDSIGILVVAYVTLISCVPGASHLALCIRAGCS